MARKPRSYVRKIKGCHQCLKRRINCDRGEPSCVKCVSRGIACSGLGFNYRFRNGLPSKLRGGEQGNARCHDASPSQKDSIQTFSAEDWSQSVEGCILSEVLYDETQPSFDWDNFSSPPNSPGTALAAALPYTSTWNDFLLTYFSENICPEMVVLDDAHNGWRQHILPIACADEMVLKCVLSVSSFHLSQRSPSHIKHIAESPREHFLQAIAELQSRRCLDQCDLQTKQFVVVAIILLLAAVMVNGCSDFRILFHMLQSALESIGGEEGLADGDLASFLRREIHKMRVYGAPFIGADIGRKVLQAQAKTSFDCLQYYGRLHPTHSETFQLITSLREQAYWIYLQRAAAETGTSVPVHAVEDFISGLNKLTANSVGEHTLVWAAFIVASESEIPSHRLFLEGFLRRQYERNGFGNISKALELLQVIWRRKDCENWTGLLHVPGVFIM